MASLKISSPASIISNPPLAFRFSVLFMLVGVIPNSVDTLFQKVSGIGLSVETTQIEEGGQNLYTQSVPKKISHAPLVLQRGLVLDSKLGTFLKYSISNFEFYSMNVLVMLLDAQRKPMAGWMFLKAFPTKWSISDFDADSNSVIIEHMALTYQTMQSMSL